MSLSLKESNEKSFSMFVKMHREKGGSDDATTWISLGSSKMISAEQSVNDVIVAQRARQDASSQWQKIHRQPDWNGSKLTWNGLQSRINAPRARAPPCPLVNHHSCIKISTSKQSTSKMNHSHECCRAYCTLFPSSVSYLRIERANERTGFGMQRPFGCGQSSQITRVRHTTPISGYFH